MEYNLILFKLSRDLWQDKEWVSRTLFPTLLIATFSVPNTHT